MSVVGIFQLLLLLLLTGSIAYTTLAITDKTLDDFSSQVGIMSAINGAIIFFMCILSFVYIRAEPLQERTYLLILLHLSLFMSLMSVSISSLQKL